MPACDACEGTGQVGGTTDRCIICNGLGSVPDEGPQIRFAPTPFLRPGEMVAVQINLPQGPRVVGRVASSETQHASATVGPTARFWLHTGQTAYLVGSNPQRRVQIVEVTDRVETRAWSSNGRTTELGDRFTFPIEEFERDWRPYYNSNQTQPGHQYVHTFSGNIYEVVRDTLGQFVVRNHTLDDEVVLDRNAVDTEEWVYIGLPIQKYRIPSRTASTGITTQAPPLPLSRFDRDDIV